MIHKTEAYLKTVRVNSLNAAKEVQLEKIEKLIEDTILKGLFCVNYNSQPENIIYNEVLDTLKKKKYKVKKLCTDVINIDWSYDDDT